MNLGLTADELLTTTRAVRKRLDLNRAVDRETLLECTSGLQSPILMSRAKAGRQAPRVRYGQWAVMRFD